LADYLDGMLGSGTPTKNSASFHGVFRWLRGIAEEHSPLVAVGNDLTETYTLVAEVGPATVRVRGPKSAGTSMPVVYLKSGKSYVSYHLMGLYMNPSLTRQVSEELNKRRQGKTCFNFRKIDPGLAAELRQLTEKSILALRTAGYIV
jgi:hypothetical protein